MLYENVRAQRRTKEKGVDKQLADDFVKFLEEKMKRLSQVITSGINEFDSYRLQYS